MKLSRFFPMARHENWGGGPSGWYVCDFHNFDKTNLSRPITDEPCYNEAEAREIADMLNEEENSK
jgi:hypothetical protein